MSLPGLFKIRSHYRPKASTGSFVGDIGELFYDFNNRQLRISDGSTPGGISIADGGAGGVTNYNDLTNKPDLTIYQLSATAFSGSYNDLSNKPSIPTNTNELTNDAGFITAGALSGLATETYVTTRGYITDVPEATASTKGGIKLGRGLTKDANGVVDAFSGSYNDLTDRPTIPTDINQLSDASGLLSGGGGSGSDGLGISNVAVNESGRLIITFTDNTTVDAGYVVGPQGEQGVTGDAGPAGADGSDGVGVATATVNESGNLIITLTNSSIIDAGYVVGPAGESSGTISNPYSWSIAADDSALREISASETVKFIGNTGITTASDSEGNITITGPDLSNYVTLDGEQTLTNKTLTSPTITNGVFQDSFTIGSQIFYEQGTNGFSVNEDFDIVGENNFTGYHFTSGAGRNGVAFTLARTGQFTTGFGIQGTSSANEYVIGSETANTDFVFKNNIGMPFDVSGGSEVFRISKTGVLTVTQGETTENVATESFVTGQGYITTASLAGLATESFVTTQGYLSSVDWTIITNKPTLFSGSYTDLTDKPTDFNGSVFGDDSTLLVDAINSTIPYSVLSGVPVLSAIATSGLSVAEINESNQDTINFSNITALKFDTDSGFAVTDLGNGAVKIAMNSTFKTWHVEGEENLVAEGLDDVEFVAGNGIILQTDALASPYKQLIITTPPKTVQLFQDGTLQVINGTVRWYNPADLTISKIIFRLATAADDTVSVRIKKTGQTFSTTNINANTTKVVVEGISLHMTTDDYLTVDITAVGDTAKGSGLSVEFFYTLT